jgi:hypothetical protein
MMDASEANVAAIAAGAGSAGTRQAFYRAAITGRMASGIGAGLFAFGLLAKWEAEHYQGIVDGINARLGQLQLVQDGTCPDH